MDFLPDVEFHPLFDRTSKRVNLRGCGTPEEIHTRLKQRIREYKAIYGNTPISQFQGENKVAGLRTLIASGFGRRCIDEAMARPRGKVALTLKYGRDKAIRIINRRKLIS
jgi:hypothetical protein